MARKADCSPIIMQQPQQQPGAAVDKENQPPLLSPNVAAGSSKGLGLGGGSGSGSDGCQGLGKKRKLPPGGEGESGGVDKQATVTTTTMTPASNQQPQQPPRKRPLLRSNSTPPPSAVASRGNSNPFAAARPVAATASTAAALAALASATTTNNDNDENAAPPAPAPLPPAQQQPPTRPPPAFGSKAAASASSTNLFGLLGSRALNAGDRTKSLDDEGLIMARLGSLASIRLELPAGSKSPGGGLTSPDAAASSSSSSRGHSRSDLADAGSPFNEGYGTRRALPRDRSLKAGLTFESPFPFHWCRAIPGRAQAAGMLRHLREEAVGGAEAEIDAFDVGATEDAALSAWVAGTMYHAHPAEALPAPQHLPLQLVRRQMEGAFARDPALAPPSLLGLEDANSGSGGGGGSDQAMSLYRRLRQWEEAFRHLYTLYRHDPAAGGFYLQAGEFTVAWTHDDGNGSEEEEEEGEEGEGQPLRLKAIISSSKRWFRARLRAADVAFTCPLAPDVEARDRDQDPNPSAASELEELLSTSATAGHAMVELEARRRKPRHQEVAPHRSALIVTGATAVHGLFALLTDPGACLAPSAVGDVPRLLSSRPFAHGSLARLQVVLNTQVQRTLPSAAAAAGAGEKKGAVDNRNGNSNSKGRGRMMETVYQLKLRGPVLPGMLRRLAGAVHFMQRQQAEEEGQGGGGGGDWSLVMEMAPGTEAFNAVGKDGDGEGDASDGGDAALMSMKEVRWGAEKQRFVTIRMTTPRSSGGGGAPARGAGGSRRL